ncbi:Os12g0546400 [Oryza sativa Japonica Group]|uniref:Os12g0546400 protein n=1 Tax=Oryza sativa subsp. japonica TaxID=39947 RepID=A0A0P0YB06_ORYSJ|nr:Os12g0546400 [Oryza sativa Japonica Group]
MVDKCDITLVPSRVKLDDPNPKSGQFALSHPLQSGLFLHRRRRKMQGGRRGLWRSPTQDPLLCKASKRGSAAVSSGHEEAGRLVAWMLR